MRSRSYLARIHANGVAAAETHEPATLSEFEQVLQSFGSWFAIHSQCRIRVEAIPETHIAAIPKFGEWQSDQADAKAKNAKAQAQVGAKAAEERARATRGVGDQPSAFGRVVKQADPHYGEPSFACALANTLVCRNAWVAAG